MAEQTWGFDQTSGNVVSPLTSGPWFIDTQGIPLTYVTTPTPQVGVGCLEMNIGEYFFSGISPSTYFVGQPVYVDFFAWLNGVPTTQPTRFAGGAYYGQSGAVAVDQFQRFGQMRSDNVFTVASGNNTVPTGQWVRFAFQNRTSLDGLHGEARLFKGANLLGTTPDATVNAGIGSEGYMFVGPYTGTTPSITYIDDLKINDTTWPDRTAAPAFNPNVSGQMNH